MANRQMMVISVTAKDRPGIVAEVTEGIGRLDGNLADLSQTVLCGQFTMILLAGFPDGISVEQVQRELASSALSAVLVMPHDGAMSESGPPEHAYVLTAIGKDRRGLVAQISRFCLDRKVNILDLATHVEGDQYTMVLQVDLSSIDDVPLFQNELKMLGARCGLRTALQHNDIFKATNEV